MTRTAETRVAPTAAPRARAGASATGARCDLRDDARAENVACESYEEAAATLSTRTGVPVGKRLALPRPGVLAPAVQNPSVRCICRGFRGSPEGVRSRWATGTNPWKPRTNRGAQALTVGNYIAGARTPRKRGSPYHRSKRVFGGGLPGYPFDESRGVSPAMGSGFCPQCAVAKGDRGDNVWLLRVLAQPGGMRFDGVEFLRADTHRGWGISSMARAAAHWARFS